MEHIVKTYILLLFSLLVSSIGYAQEENDIIYIQEGKWGVILCGERGYAWLDNKGDTIFGFGKLQEISAEQLIPCEYDSISSWWEYGPSAHYVVKDKKVGID